MLSHGTEERRGDQEIILEMIKHKIDMCGLSATKRKGQSPTTISSTKTISYFIVGNRNKNECTRESVFFYI